MKELVYNHYFCVSTGRQTKELQENHEYELTHLTGEAESPTTYDEIVEVATQPRKNLDTPEDTQSEDSGQVGKRGGFLCVKSRGLLPTPASRSTRRGEVKGKNRGRGHVPHKLVKKDEDDYCLPLTPSPNKEAASQSPSPYLVMTPHYQTAHSKNVVQSPQSPSPYLDIQPSDEETKSPNSDVFQSPSYIVVEPEKETSKQPETIHAESEKLNGKYQKSQHILNNDQQDSYITEAICNNISVEKPSDHENNENSTEKSKTVKNPEERAIVKPRGVVGSDNSDYMDIFSDSTSDQGTKLDLSSPSDVPGSPDAVTEATELVHPAISVRDSDYSELLATGAGRETAITPDPD